MGDAVAHFEQDLQVFDGAAEVPVRLNHVRGLVVIVADVFGPFHHPEAGWFTGVVDAGAGFERGYAAAGEFVVIGTEVEALLGRGVAGEDAALACHRFRREIVQRRITDADDAEIACRSPAPVAEVIQVDIRNGGRKRIERMIDVVTGAEQSFFFGGGPEENDGPFGRRIQSAKRTSQFQHAGGPGRVVARTVEDLIALLTVMVPMAGVNHVLVLHRRVAAFDLRE